MSILKERFEAYMDSSPYLGILAAVFLVILNGFYVAAEFALVKVRTTKIDELIQGGNRRAGEVKEILAKLDEYLSVCQLGITLASLALGWIGEPAISRVLAPVFVYFHIPEVYTPFVSIILGFTIITALHIVFGETVPKYYAIKRSEEASLKLTIFLQLSYMLFYPIVYVLNRASNAILRSIGVEPSEEEGLHSEEELRMIVSASHAGGMIDAIESELIDNVFEFSETMAREVMVSRKDMVCLYLEDTVEDVLKVVEEHNHARYPICGEDKDNVIGVVHIRELFKDIQKNAFNLHKYRDNILIVPESMSISILFQSMRSKKAHMAIVADEYGGTAGLLTIEDIIEEIVGDIYDEHETIEREIVKTNETTYEINGLTHVEDVVEALDIKIGEHDEDTIGGYIFGQLGRKPRNGDIIIIWNYEFRVVQTAGTRIVKIIAQQIEEPAEAVVS
jgi:CBS domain containing-hemolysin-like protein